MEVTMPKKLKDKDIWADPPLRSDQLRVGDRVLFPDGYETYPFFSFIGERLTGTVVDLENKGFVFVKVDQYKEELDEWQNEIHVYVECPGDDLEGPVPGIVRLRCE
jgi:hypothetical protein